MVISKGQQEVKVNIVKVIPNKSKAEHNDPYLIVLYDRNSQTGKFRSPAKVNYESMIKIKLKL